MRNIFHWNGAAYYVDYFKDGVQHWVSVGQSTLHASSLRGVYFENVEEVRAYFEGEKLEME